MEIIFEPARFVSTMIDFMGAGMLGIFIVIGLIVVATMILNKVTALSGSGFDWNKRIGNSEKGTDDYVKPVIAWVVLGAAVVAAFAVALIVISVLA